MNKKSSWKLLLIGRYDTRDISVKFTAFAPVRGFSYSNPYPLAYSKILGWAIKFQEWLYHTLVTGTNHRPEKHSLIRKMKQKRKHLTSQEVLKIMCSSQNTMLIPNSRPHPVLLPWTLISITYPLCFYLILGVYLNIMRNHREDVWLTENLDNPFTHSVK